MVNVLQIVGTVLAGALAITGCALLWHNVNGLSNSSLSARYDTAAIFDYIYLLFFTILAIVGGQTSTDGLVRVGLLGLASLVYLVHTDSTVGHGWANCNLYRLATNDGVKYPADLDGYPTSFNDKDANRELLAGTVLCLFASLVALFSAIPAKERRPVSKISLLTFVIAGITILALSISWWSSDVTSIASNSSLPQIATYHFSLKIIAGMIITLVILGAGLFFDVEEYVVVAAFFASRQFCYILSYALRMLDMQRAAPSAHDLDASKAGAVLFYLSAFVLMISCAAYFAEQTEREHVPAFINHLFLVVAILLIIPGAAMLWHQCRGLGRDVNGSSSQYEFRANVAEVFGYVYVVLAAIGTLLGTKMTGKPGMITFFIVICASMLFNMSNTRGNFSWSNGNVFREADMSDIQLKYGVEYSYKETLNHSDSDRQVAGGFTLVQLAGFFSLLSMIRLPEHTHNVLVLALAGTAIGVFVACGIFEAEAPNNNLDASNIGTVTGSFIYGGSYYPTMMMVCNFFFMAFFVLLGFALGVREFVSLSIIAISFRGLQTLQASFFIGDNISKGGIVGRDRVLVAGALGFTCSLLVVAAAVLYFNDKAK